MTIRRAAQLAAELQSLLESAVGEASTALRLVDRMGRLAAMAPAEVEAAGATATLAATRQSVALDSGVGPLAVRAAEGDELPRWAASIAVDRSGDVADWAEHALATAQVADWSRSKAARARVEEAMSWVHSHPSRFLDVLALAADRFASEGPPGPTVGRVLETFAGVATEALLDRDAEQHRPSEAALAALRRARARSVEAGTERNPWAQLDAVWHGVLEHLKPLLTEPAIALPGAVAFRGEDPSVTDDLLRLTRSVPDDRPLVRAALALEAGSTIEARRSLRQCPDEDAESWRLRACYAFRVQREADYDAARDRFEHLRGADAEPLPDGPTDGTLAEFANRPAAEYITGLLVRPDARE